MGTDRERRSARPPWAAWAAVALGGAIGTGLRLTADLLLPYPWSLVLVNVLGSAALLVLLLGVWPRRPHAPGWLRDGLRTGVLGAFTTLSAVSLAFVGAGQGYGVDGPALFAAAVGAGLVGTLLRYGAVRATSRLGFPVGVLAVNVLGSLVAGVAVAALLRGELDPGAAAVVIAGGCGGLTTFSTVVGEAVRAWVRGRRAASLLILAANLALGAGAAWLGLQF